MKKHNVGIIGAGVAGLALAYRLIKLGHEVTLYEKNKFAGGQLYSFPIEGENTEIYYHHTFMSDENFISLCKELGIENKLQWYDSSMAYYSKGKQFPFGTPLDLLRFTPLKFMDKIKFGISIFHLQSIKNIHLVESFSAKEWFYEKGYSNVWDVIWEPLFKLKFAELADEISLVWLWDKLIKRGKSRNSGKEKLCYMEGSFFELALALEKEIISSGGTILTNTGIEKIHKEDGVFILNTSNMKKFEHDSVVSTLSTKHHQDIFKTEPSHLQKYDYQSAICALLVLNKPFSQFYWTNVGDYALPFGGIIEHTNFVGKEKYAGKTILYLSKYLDKKSAFYQKSNDEILNDFYLGLEKVNEQFERNSILDAYVFKQPDAQPIVKKGYNPPQIKTEITNLYWISTHHVYPHDRGIEYGIELANKVADYINE